MISELIANLNNGKIMIVKIIYKKGDGYYVRFGKGFPRQYDIVDAKPGLVIYRLGTGNRKAWLPGKTTVHYRVPAGAKPKEGYAIAEFKDDLVYLYLG